MIKDLLKKDKSHKIIAGLSVIIYVNGEYKEYKLFDEVKVYLKNILDEEINRWIEIRKAMDKAAGYGIQNKLHTNLFHKFGAEQIYLKAKEKI